MWFLGFFKSRAANTNLYREFAQHLRAEDIAVDNANAFLPSHPLNATWFFATYPSTSINNPHHPLCSTALYPATCLSQFVRTSQK